MRFIVTSLSLLLSSAAYAANGVEQLHQFLEGSKTAKASFTQSVISKSGKEGQKASGSMIFQRPGKFRWTYEKPYNQLIVGDGSKLWSYDKELNQVVIKPMSQALGSSPAALLAGDNALEKNFDLKDGGENGGLAWLDATPKNNEAGFERVRIGFKGGLPQAMEVKDNFGQTTVLQFVGFERNVSVTAETFRFVPPKGADVIGEGANP
ncbi:outer membrane lipoprotein chaperone LolA [Uliginosibacterium sp. H3]|uniref:Outer-membrane lipoprotein carrier protein n=1 Tax=Uliginosibacterium silvisoli TaxID=3114758 RepID=A0ABU6K848_9RHOO|nr:outer membrane lipoprotein chaperone LolA [Uliginosibacterium sp. H3]